MNPRPMASGSPTLPETTSLRDQARRCRRLAGSISDTRTIDVLQRMAGAFEAEAERTERLH